MKLIFRIPKRFFLSIYVISRKNLNFILTFQVVKSKYGIQNFQGIPFDNFPTEALSFRNKWTALWKLYTTKIRRQISRNSQDPKALENIEVLKGKKMICAHDFSGLMAQFSSHPPRLPAKPP